MRLPLAQRELARLGRSRRVYAWRALVIGSAALMVSVVWAGMSEADLARGPEAIGAALHGWCILAQVAILFVVLPALAAPAIASERQQHMLPLLLIADFRGWDILAAKALVVLVEAGLLLLALAPIQFMSTAFGGVTPGVIWAQTGVLAALVLFAVMASMLCSCFVRNPAGATFAGVALVAGTLLALYLTDLLLLKRQLQFENLRVLFFEIGSAAPRCRRAIAVVLALAAACACFVVWLLPRIAGDPPRRYWVGAPTPYGHTSRRLLRWGPVLPILSVHATGLTSTLRGTPVRILVALLLSLIGVVPVIGTLIVVMLLVQEVTLSLGNAERSGALDDLRVTLLEPKTIARDIVDFYMRRGILYMPALIVCAIQIAVFADSAYFGPGTPQREILGNAAAGAVYVFSLTAGVVALGVAQVFAIVSLSCLMGISGRDARRQVGTTLAIIGAAYALCVTGTQSQDHLMYLLRLGDVWIRVPLVLGGCCLVFLILGMSARAELYRHLDGTTLPRSLPNVRPPWLHRGGAAKHA